MQRCASDDVAQVLFRNSDRCALQEWKDSLVENVLVLPVVRAVHQVVEELRGIHVVSWNEDLALFAQQQRETLYRYASEITLSIAGVGSDTEKGERGVEWKGTQVMMGRALIYLESQCVAVPIHDARAIGSNWQRTYCV